MPGNTKNRTTLLIVATVLVFGALITIIITGLIILSQKAPTAAENTPAQVSVDIGDAERKKWPILDHLPYKNTLFALGYTIKNDELILYVDTTDTNLEAALKKLSSFTSEPLKSYTIEIKNPKNPFAGAFIENNAADPEAFIALGYQNLANTFKIVSSHAQPSTQSGKSTYLVDLTTGSSEAYNLVHWTAEVTKSSTGELKLEKDPTPTLLLDL